VITLTFVLANHGYIDLPSNLSSLGFSAPVDELGTVIANMAYYGYAPSAEAITLLQQLDSEELQSYWVELEPVLATLTGDDKDIELGIVYKNFPAEVLSMSQAEYWFNQVCMYVGFSKELFTQEEEERAPLNEAIDLKILHVEKSNTLEQIASSLLKSPVRWNKTEQEEIEFIIKHGTVAVLSEISFKENFASLAESILEMENIPYINSTDVLRMGAALSGADLSNGPVRFRKFKRSERRQLLGMLSTNHLLKNDVAMRPEVWKRFLYSLHPGDYKAHYPVVVEAYNQLYKKSLPKSYNSKIEIMLAENNPEVLDLLVTRPGVFLRRFVKTAKTFGNLAAMRFTEVIPELTIMQLVKFKAYLDTISFRETRIFPPRGNWTKAQIGEPVGNIPGRIKIISAIENELNKRLSFRYPQGVSLDPMSSDITLPENDSTLTEYNRGTVFHIPQEANFVRTASFWTSPRHTVWFDNGWNFFNEEWIGMDSVCWNKTDAIGALFSGDPLSSRTKDGHACQVIDLNIDELKSAGVRYAVWNILCFSGKKFSEAPEGVFGALQWGENAQEGKIFEPSRAQLTFTIKDEALTKYIALLDVETRSIVYLDANLKGHTHSAKSNQKILTEFMPPYMEYIYSLPTVMDLFDTLPKSADGTKILYDDKEAVLQDEEDAYVFQKLNPESSFTQINLNEILSSKE